MSLNYCLVTSCVLDPVEKGKGKLGKVAYLEDWVSKFTSVSAEDHATFSINFSWDDSHGVPGAFLIRNHHHSEFFLKTVTLEDVPGHGQLHFVCNSWVYPTKRYKKDRIFFANKVSSAHKLYQHLRNKTKSQLYTICERYDALPTIIV